MTSTFENEASFKATVCSWYKAFSHSRKNFGDDVREDRSRSAAILEYIDTMRKLIPSDRHVRYAEIETSL